ncbi:hypothetical protein [Haloterrigena alkaliphila]|uniref:hypothetical protein n=1 Tax=Haloterrigena alkaliphila TaxID=2816475 RepID=UPI001CFFA07C|nr:hypothetical protein [Haloterrigena alkaliphila]UHQ95095.1 hypothetical protein J0X25_19770 [Haloterrigena alkaliphila]
MDALGIARRTTWYNQYRTQAYDFPLEKFEQGRSAGTTAEELNLGDPDEVWGVAVTDTGTESDDVMEGHPERVLGERGCSVETTSGVDAVLAVKMMG